MTDARKLAGAFADNLRAALGETLIEEVSRRNAAESDAIVCHSHDFCDANVFMLEAMESQGLEFDPADEAQAALIDEAWRLAKAAGFDPHAFD